VHNKFGDAIAAKLSFFTARQKSPRYTKVFTPRLGNLFPNFQRSAHYLFPRRRTLPKKRPRDYVLFFFIPGEYKLFSIFRGNGNAVSQNYRAI